jgi:hypothetical protein
MPLSGLMCHVMHCGFHKDRLRGSKFFGKGVMHIRHTEQSDFISQHLFFIFYFFKIRKVEEEEEVINHLRIPV